MAYEFLINLFGQNEDGTPKAMTADELVTAINGAKDLKLANLASGDYVDKSKFDRVSEELKTVNGQLTEANTTIQSYKDMDIDGIKKSADEWKTKYDSDTKALKDRLDQQEYDFAKRQYLAGYKFTDPLAEEGVSARFSARNFKLVDGKFEGADAFMEELKKSNPGAFVIENPNPAPQPPQFQNPLGTNPTPSPDRKMTLTEAMEYANANPGTNIEALMERVQ